MKSIALKLFALVALAAGAAALSFVGPVPAPEAEAIPGCQCLPGEYTPQVTGVSTTDCVWAKMDAQNQAYALADCPSGEYCDRFLQVIDDNDCNKFWPSGEFRVVARAYYSCGTCDP